MVEGPGAPCYLIKFYAMPVHKICLLAVVTFLAGKNAAQDTTGISAELTLKNVVTRKHTYHLMVLRDSSQRMVSVTRFIPGIVLELRYAGSDNFVHRPMYPRGTRETYLRLFAARDLLHAEEELNRRGLGLMVFDAYRPYRVTRKFWEMIHDERYVANPKTGSGHNRGIAVDCTLIDLQTGRPLEMGTDFDNFTDSAHESFAGLPGAVIARRRLLREIMEKSGFVQLETEWWHYSLPHPEKYAVLDLDIARGREYFGE